MPKNSNYSVKVKTDNKLLKEFAVWLKTQPYGSVGYFDLITDKIPKEITDNQDLIKNGHTIFHLPEGSLICLDEEARVHYLKSEGGEDNIIADNLTAFLNMLVTGETQVRDLDDVAVDRTALATWLKEKKLFNENKKAEGESANISYEDLVSLFGERPESSKIASLLKKLKAKMPKVVIEDQEFRLVVPNDGLTLIFNTPKGESGKENLILQTIQIFPVSPGNGIKAPYLGKLPGGVLLTDGQKEFHQKLGEPTEIKEKFRMDAWNQDFYRFTVQYTKDMSKVNYINISHI